MIDPVQRFSNRRGQCLRRANTNRQGAHQAGAGSDGHRIDIVKSYAGLVKGAFKRGKEGLKVSARSDFGDNSAITGVLIH